MADLFLGGALVIDQPKTGHRSGTDAVLLAACAPPQARGLALDMGAGVGVVGLCVLRHAPGLRAKLVEFDPVLAAHAAANAAANGLHDRAEAVAADILTAKARRAGGLADDSADFVFTNPPFYEGGRVRATPDAAKARAHVGDIAPWLKACCAVLKPGGWLFMIHRADALPQILQAAEGRLGDLRLKFVFGAPAKPAIRLLIAGRKGARGALQILPQLGLYDAAGARAVAEKDIAMGRGLIDMAVKLGRPRS